MGRPKGAPAAPPKLDWDLWLGPAAKRPYHEAYHPYNWRGWVDFGTGALGAMGCHILDAAFWALKLDQADTFTVQADSTGTSGLAWPKASTIRYRFPPRGDMPAVTVTWFDGGRKPPRPPELPATREHVGSNGTFFIGDKCKMALGGLIAGTHPGQAGPRLMPEHLMGSSRPKQTIPRVRSDKKMWHERSRHEQEWVAACKKGRQPCSSFDHAGPLTEMVLLGNVALLAGKPIEWDRKKMKIVNEPAANKFLRREYRSGWTL
jgi:predicted dehydrogenase